MTSINIDLTELEKAIARMRAFCDAVGRVPAVWTGDGKDGTVELSTTDIRAACNSVPGMIEEIRRLREGLEKIAGGYIGNDVSLNQDPAAFKSDMLTWSQTTARNALASTRSAGQ